ncbi:transcriptional regulator [Actinomycetospora sp. NBRC 106375]|uniref:helix-turn-helix domain-containing protein n=1 Tax=Actinomycetospora sp. NBRC 106375 TaxID=3032207 RepID=UPI0024A0F6C6|nr:helix-turn-helix transcriptional regulator [Actinomycetospora sp. NBRC 106375]GLZ50193.1 transcriptional regulator [Actinomycetospora sp. NBRC 106375]
MREEQRGRRTELGAFLGARRRRVDPRSVELSPDGRARRVPGLRREELAELADVSTDYYTRLEQGRERHPSPQVLASLARALRLHDEEIGHLFRLAGQAPPPVEPLPAAPGPDLRALLHPSLVRVPVTVLDRALDVVDMNPASVGLHAGFGRRDNLLRMVFGDPAARSFYGDEWDLTARAAVASLRESSARFPGDGRIAEVAAELTERSASFAALWSSREITVSPCPGTHRLCHPVLGELDLHCTTLANVAVPGQHLQVFTPEPGSRTARRVEQLTLLRAGAEGRVGSGP